MLERRPLIFCYTPSPLQGDVVCVNDHIVLSNLRRVIIYTNSLFCLNVQVVNHTVKHSKYEPFKDPGGHFHTSADGYAPLE